MYSALSWWVCLICSAVYIVCGIHMSGSRDTKQNIVLCWGGQDDSFNFNPNDKECIFIHIYFK